MNDGWNGERSDMLLLEGRSWMYQIDLTCGLESERTNGSKLKGLPRIDKQRAVGGNTCVCTSRSIHDELLTVWTAQQSKNHVQSKLGGYKHEVGDQ